MLAPGSEDEPGAEGVVELPPGAVQRRRADANVHLAVGRTTDALVAVRLARQP